MLQLLLTITANAAISYWLIRRARLRAYAEGWNVGHKQANEQYERGFGAGMAAWARISREFTVSKSSLKN
jgi:hypothetical protein